MNNHDVLNSEMEKYIGSSSRESSDTLDTDLFKEEKFSDNYKLVQIKLVQKLIEQNILQEKDIDSALKEFSKDFAPAFAEHINQDELLRNLILNANSPKSFEHISNILIPLLKKPNLKNHKTRRNKRLKVHTLKTKRPK